jgi:hypothetical protein
MYDDCMGNPNLQREVSRARSTYLGSLARLARAMNDFHDARVPLDANSRGRLPPWTREHVTVMRACAEAWPAVVEARRVYDALVRDLGRPAARPYA